MVFQNYWYYFFRVTLHIGGCYHTQKNGWATPWHWLLLYYPVWAFDRRN